MEENKKVIVFEKKEIVLIILFMLVLIVTTFTTGFSLGKKLKLEAAGITAQDQKTVELKSGQEEDVEKIVSEDSQVTDMEKKETLIDQSNALLTENLEKFSTEEKPALNQSTEGKTSSNPLSGQFTIQLGSYPTIEEAKNYAEGFTARGYNPIINEISLENKGTWYRVSLGLFGSVAEAKAYIKNEKSLFSEGQDYVITEIK